MMEERIDSEVVDWARRIPVDQIACVLAFLSARLLAEASPATVASTTAKARAIPAIS
jgi:hypothetical protein